MTDLALTLTTDQWQTIDGTMDNTAALMPVTRPPSDHDRPVRIRRAATGVEPAETPSGDLTITVRLAREDWQYVVAELAAAVPFYEQTGEAALHHETIATISRHLP